MSDKTRFCLLHLAFSAPPCVQPAESAAHLRLTRGFARLRTIQLVRNHRQDPRFGRAMEERIVWRELLELEIQAIDDHIERTSLAVGAGAE